MTVSAWWVFGSFLVGGCAGVLLMALMFVASAEEEHVDALLAGTITDPPDSAHVPA